MLPPTQDQDKDTATCPSLPQDAVTCPPPTSGCCDVFSPPSGCCDVFSPPSGCCDVFSPHSGCCDVFSPHSRCCNVFSTTLRHRMMLCVLSLTRAAAQAVTVKKVDLHAPPPPEEEVVHAVEEAAHPQPLHTVKVSPSFPVGDDDVCDRLVVTDEQGGIVVSVFLLSHMHNLRRFFPQLLFPSLFLSWQAPPLPTPSSLPGPTTLLHIPQPSLPMVRARTPQSGRCTPQLTAAV